ncbi:MAG: endonuclease NucS domain-containing protein [Candidatus Altiarchaeota archaeon]
MNLGEACSRLVNDLNDHNTIIIVAKCGIEYWGRSRSVIGHGDRIIMLKPDTTIIVHSPDGFKPVNWMSSPTDTAVNVEDDELRIFSQRTRTPYEEIRISIGEIHDYRSYTGLRDREKLDLTHTEKDMRDYLVENPHHIHPELKVKSVEYRSPLGFFDIYGRIGETPTVVELKAERAGLPAALQIKRYKEWLESHLKVGVRAMLVSPSITPNSLSLLKKSGIEHVKFNIRKMQRKPRRGHTLEKWID